MFSKIFLISISLFLTYSSFGQTELNESKTDSIWYEIIRNPKHPELFTTEGTIILEAKLKELRHIETVYYNVSEWTTIKIYPIKED